MAVGTTRTAAIIIPFALLLSGCDEMQGVQSSPESVASAQLGADGTRTEIQDIERADIFSATENGLWDGRPSLGGVWIAHPDVSEPERARITNTDNGQTVSGALFRRERANPGPRFQVSSDAATALGMLAGQPTELTVVVVRQEEIELEPTPLPLSEEGTTEIDVAPSSENNASRGEEVAETAVASAAGAAVAVDASQTRPRGFWGRFRDSLRNKPAADVAEEADTARIEDTTENASVPDVEIAPLDPIVSTASAAIAEAESATVVPTTSSTLKNPYVQVGLFSVEENASAAAASLRQNGIVPTVSEQQSDDKRYWRIFVGPVSSSDEQAEILAQVKRLGYKDAFLAPN